MTFLIKILLFPQKITFNNSILTIKSVNIPFSAKRYHNKGTRKPTIITTYKSNSFIIFLTTARKRFFIC